MNRREWPTHALTLLPGERFRLATESEGAVFEADPPFARDPSGRVLEASELKERNGGSLFVLPIASGKGGVT